MPGAECISNGYIWPLYMAPLTCSAVELFLAVLVAHTLRLVYGCVTTMRWARSADMGWDQASYISCEDASIPAGPILLWVCDRAATKRQRLWA